MPFDPTEDIKAEDLPMKSTAVNNNDKIIIIDNSDGEVKLTKVQDIKGTDSYTKAQIDTKLAQKADKDEIITKTDGDGTKFLNDKGEYREVASGSGGTVGKTFTTNVAIGGIAAGTTIYSTDTVGSVFERMFVMYIAPAITCSITPSTTLYAKGDTVNITKLTAGVTKNSKDIQSVTFQMGSTVLDTLTAGVAEGGNFDYVGTIPAITTNTTLTVSCTDGTSTKSASKNIEFIVPFFYGPTSSNTIDSVAGLTRDLTKKGAKTYYYTTNNQYITIVYDNSYGQLTSIKDANGFEGISGFDSGTFTDNGTTYRYYSSQLATTDTNAKYTFTF